MSTSVNLLFKDLLLLDCQGLIFYLLFELIINIERVSRSRVPFGDKPMFLSDLQFDRNILEKLCRRYGVRRLEVIGSFARGDAGPESDLDILVTFDPQTEPGLEFFALHQELEAILCRPVDLLTRVSVERSRNKYFRRFALRQTEPLYERT